MGNKQAKKVNPSRFVGGIHTRPQAPLRPSQWAQEAGSRAYDAVIQLSKSTSVGIDLDLLEAADFRLKLEEIAAQYELDREWRNRLTWSEYVKSLDTFKAAAEKLVTAWDGLSSHAQELIGKHMPEHDSAAPRSRLRGFRADLHAFPRAVERAHESILFHRDGMSKDEQSRAGKNPDIHLHAAVKSLADLWAAISPRPIAHNWRSHSDGAERGFVDPGLEFIQRVVQAIDPDITFNKIRSALKSESATWDRKA
ncbi:MAG: hypothetical protein ACTHNH_12945 [Mesorhizobium sp.]